ncbi:MAG: helix-turn-helix transcriptional regulator [Lachnospiraceae bacterium]|nr:helix-turn-helix transcriptional regulator [Lachnospiraceae bacterium]
MRIDRIKFTVLLTTKDLTLSNLATMSGVSRTTLSSIKQGKRCSVETAKKIAKALNVDVTEILED